MDYAVPPGLWPFKKRKPRVETRGYKYVVPTALMEIKISRVSQKIISRCVVRNCIPHSALRNTIPQHTCTLSLPILPKSPAEIRAGGIDALRGADVAKAVLGNLIGGFDRCDIFFLRKEKDFL